MTHEPTIHVAGHLHLLMYVPVSPNLRLGLPIAVHMLLPLLHHIMTLNVTDNIVPCQVILFEYIIGIEYPDTCAQTVP